MNKPELFNADGTPSGAWISTVFTLMIMTLIICGAIWPNVALAVARMEAFTLTAYLGSLGFYLGKKGFIEYGKLKHRIGEEDVTKNVKELGNPRVRARGGSADRDDSI